MGFIATLLLMGMSIAVQAQAFAPESMARYFPSDVNVYAALRIDAGYVTTLDGVLQNITGKLPAALNVPQLTLTDALTMGLPPSVKLADIQAFLGDYAALGAVVDPTAPEGSDPEAAYVALAITDKAAATEFLLSQNDTLVGTEEGEWTIYPIPTGLLAVGEDVVLISMGELPDVSGGSLADEARFTEAFAKLPAESYNIVAYLETAILYATALRDVPVGTLEVLQTQGISEALILGLPPTVIGFTVLNETALAVDWVSPTVPGITPQLSPVNPEFLSVVPAEMSFVVQVADLGSLVESSIQAAVAATGETFDEESASRPVQALLNVSFPELLSVLGGNAVVFADLDMRPIAEQVAAGETPTELPLRFGIVLEVVDAANTAKIRDNIVTLLRAQGANPDSPVTTEDITIGSASGIAVRGLPLELGGDLDQTLDVVVVSDDRLFVVADLATAETIFEGGSDLTATNAYQTEAAHFLPNPSLVLYTDGDGIGDLVLLGGFGFASFGPDNAPNGAEFVETLSFGYELFNGTSITIAVTPDGDSLIRSVLTLK
jgi:hypothetical protein